MARSPDGSTATDSAVPPTRVVANRKPTQLTTLRLSSLKMEMKELNRLLVHPDIDAIFALKATENVERTLWEVLEISYAALISEMLQSIRPRLPMSP
ncbi:hypothetical protein HPB52_002736 [Rhipicephalus sanguineus]|uniref:Uncharacterized protein n=1 Tax=Rhipicephalus sanguineus TaxID=34632 RepID=A0A9D4PGT6_RHISA|nr:hypothetical protein HPB52_002736 [Rhipicephalus sanguineus]